MTMHRKKYRSRALVALCACLLVPPAWADKLSGTVTRVRDGDSVELTTDRGEKIEVRLQAVDAPERGKAGRGQPYAEQSQDMLNRLALRKRATLETADTDSYGRTVGLLRIVTARGPVDVGLMQVQMGMAWTYPRALERLPYDLRESYAYAEKIARLKRRGLWADEKPRAPWEWRPAARKASGRS
jgi:endonuclease YncB( thermonuclease family)